MVARTVTVVKGSTMDGNNVRTDMETVVLPIDVVPGTNPPIFRWNQLIDRQIIHHEGALPASVEVAVSRLISIAKQLLMDNAALHGQVDGLSKLKVATVPVATPSKPPAQNVEKKGK